MPQGHVPNLNNTISFPGERFPARWKMSSLSCLLLELLLPSVFSAMPFVLRQKAETNEPQRQRQECFCVILGNQEHLPILIFWRLQMGQKTFTESCHIKTADLHGQWHFDFFLCALPWQFTIVSKPKPVRLRVTLYLSLAITKTVAAGPLLWLNLIESLIQPSLRVYLQIIP